MTYEYLCLACDYRFEKQHKLSEAGPSYCPDCGVVDEVKRQIPKSGSFLLKGGGWADSGYGGL